MLTAIYIFLFILQGITTGVFIHLMLTPGYSPKTIWIVWGVVSIWTPFGRMLQGVSANMKLFVTVLTVFMWTFAAILLYSDPLWKRITAPLLILCAMCFADALLILVFYLVDPIYLDDVTGINIRSTILAASAEAALVIMYMCILQIWNLIRDRRLIKGYLPTILLPVSQLCFSSGANLSAKGHSDSYSFAFLWEQFWDSSWISTGCMSFYTAVDVRRRNGSFRSCIT